MVWHVLWGPIQHCGRFVHCFSNCSTMDWQLPSWGCLIVLPCLSILLRVIQCRVLRGIQCRVLRGIQCRVLRGIQCGVLRGIQYGVLRGIQCGVLRGIQCGVLRGIQCGVLRGIQCGVLRRIWCRGSSVLQLIGGDEVVAFNTRSR